MTSFNGYTKYRYFNWETFYSEWQKLIFGVGDFNSLYGDKKRSEADKLRDKIKTLWNAFNEDRNDMTKKYSSKQKFITAYLSSFYFPNIQRTFSIITSRHNLAEVKNVFSASGDELRILDFGAGPLSASLGLLTAMDFAGFDLASKNIKIMAVERSDAMLEAGIALMKSAFGDKIKIDYANYSSALKIPDNAHFILCANVFNEIPIKHRLVNLESLLDALNGVMMVIEPGQDVHSRALNSLRNELLDTAKIKFSIISPCLHTMKCPLPLESERPDWCWFKITWREPEAITFIDKITGLDHRQLNYSYLVLKTAAPVASPKSYKVISDIIKPIGQNNRNRFENWMRNNIVEGNTKCLIRVSDDNVAKVLLCGSDGKLSSVIGNKELLASLKRGDVINSIPEGSALCKER